MAENIFKIFFVLKTTKSMESYQVKDMYAFYATCVLVSIGYSYVNYLDHVFVSTFF